MGLRHWTVLLDAADLDGVKRRLADAGIAVEDGDGSALVRDPWDNALLLGERGA